MERFKPWEFRNKYGVSKSYAYKTGKLVCTSFLCAYDVETVELLGTSISDYFIEKVKEKAPPKFKVEEETYNSIQVGDTIRCTVSLSL